MTTELEQKFYDTFGIKKICTHTIINPEKCNHRRMTRCCGCDWLDYPKITTEKLLEMICILSAYNYIFEDLKADNIEQLKEEIIKLFLDYPLIAEEEKTNIQQLFKED